MRFALNADKELDADAIGLYESLWLEGFSDLSDACLVAAFRKTIHSAKFWPVKIADVREHVARAESKATDEAAEQAWQRVLEIRRCHWNPDIPGPFNRALAALPERIRQAARASGVFRDVESADSLHVWAKKRFLESFTAYGEREQNEYLLPDGEIKNLLADFSTTKALPAPNVSETGLHDRGLAYGKKLRELYANTPYTPPEPPESAIQQRRAIEAELAEYGQRQAAILAERIRADATTK